MIGNIIFKSGVILAEKRNLKSEPFQVNMRLTVSRRSSCYGSTHYITIVSQCLAGDDCHLTCLFSVKLETGEDDLAYMWQRTGLDSQVREARHLFMQLYVTGHQAISTTRAETAPAMAIKAVMFIMFIMFIIFILLIMFKMFKIF